MTQDIPYSKNIKITNEGDHYIIRDKESGITTQGKTEIEALLMLADAKSPEEDRDRVDMMKLAADVFVMDEETEKFLREQL